MPVGFNPLPSPKQGETDDVATLKANPHEFQSAPLTEARGDSHRTSAQRRPHGVSIRSPHRSKGRPQRRPRSGRAGPRFNPLPSPKQGETAVRYDIERTLKKFQSAPLTEARGDRTEFDSPRQQLLFQSAPLTEARGDASGLAKSFFPRGFNPLPSPKQGETRRGHRPRLPLARFQSAPLTEARGDRWWWYIYAGADSFQSAPLTEARGDAAENCPTVLGDLFQSAPLTEARGDRTKASTKRTPTMFQSAPLTEARGDVNEVSNPSIADRFQSAPLTEARGDVGHTFRLVLSAAFQSAPLTEARGDAGCYNRRNTKKLHERMREPPPTCILLLK